MKVWENKTGSRSITIRTMATTSIFGTIAKLSVTYTYNKRMMQKPLDLTLVASGAFYIYDSKIECDSIVDIFVLPVATTTLYNSFNVILTVGTNEGSNFLPLQVIGNFVGALKYNNLTSCEVFQTSTTEEITHEEGASVIIGGVTANIGGDGKRLKYVDRIVGKITTTGAVTGDKVQILLNKNGETKYCIGSFIFNTLGAETIYFAFTPQCAITVREAEEIRANMGIIYRGDMTGVRVVLTSVSTLSTFNYVSFGGPTSQIYNID